MLAIGLELSLWGAGQKSEPAAPPATGEFGFDARNGTFTLKYHDGMVIQGRLILKLAGKETPLEQAGARVHWQGTVTGGAGPEVRIESNTTQTNSMSRLPVLTQRVGFSCGTPMVIHAEAVTSEQGLAAEWGRKAQEKLALIRTTVGNASDNRRNDAVYDRKWDWAASFTTDLSSPRIHPVKSGKTARRFEVTLEGNTIELDFRPHFYQAHKNIRYFEPWKYEVWPHSVCGWCSWAAYYKEINEQIITRIAGMFAEKLKDYGFDYIQIDDGYQATDNGAPQDWLNTNKERFPHGLAFLNQTIRDRGLKPSLWLNVHFSDTNVLEQHPEWFVQGPEGKPFQGGCVEYAINGTNREAFHNLVQPVYQNLKRQRWEYIKVDMLRHLLYDSYYPCRKYFEQRQLVKEEVYRDYMEALRKELGRGTYMLGSWGVLPELVGIMDACRLGRDGFGPAGLAQYNSWNNIVWRNDPDHVNIPQRRRMDPACCGHLCGRADDVDRSGGILRTRSEYRRHPPVRTGARLPSRAAL